MYGDMICHFIAIKTDGVWWLTEDVLKPASPLQRRLYGIKEHQPKNWFEMDLERAENVITLVAYYSNQTECQAFELGYCEARLSEKDIETIQKSLQSYWDIPF